MHPGSNRGSDKGEVGELHHPPGRDACLLKGLFGLSRIGVGHRIDVLAGKGEDLFGTSQVVAFWIGFVSLLPVLRQARLLPGRKDGG
ncbi:hypothetical protein D9M68_974010 [compost metagenome]